MKRENAITIATTDSQAFQCFLAASRLLHATRMQHADTAQIMFCSGARIELAPPEWRLPESGQTGRCILWWGLLRNKMIIAHRSAVTPRPAKRAFALANF
jgi:hypothetical protein